MLMLAGWINRHQQAVIAYKKEEIRVLREMLGGNRLRFTRPGAKMSQKQVQVDMTCITGRGRFSSRSPATR